MCPGKTWGISCYETERKKDFGGQLVASAMLPYRSLDSGGEEKNMAKFQHFILEWAKYQDESSEEAAGRFWTAIKRELQYLPQRIMAGLNMNVQVQQQLGVRGHLEPQDLRTELVSCPTIDFLGNVEGRILTTSPGYSIKL